MYDYYQAIYTSDYIPENVRKACCVKLELVSEDKASFNDDLKILDRISSDILLRYRPEETEAITDILRRLREDG